MYLMERDVVLPHQHLLHLFPIVQQPQNLHETDLIPPHGYLWGKQISMMLLLPSWLAQGWAATYNQPNPFSQNTPLTRVWLWLVKSDEIQNSFMIKSKLKCRVCCADFDCVVQSKLCKILKQMVI